MRKFSHSVKFYFVVQNLKIGQTLINSAKYVFFEKYEFFSQKLKTKGGGQRNEKSNLHALSHKTNNCISHK